MLYFSNYIKPVGKKIRFLFIIIGRFFRIVFRRRKDIELLQLFYAEKYLFDNSYLVIRYRFRNALWYNFKNIKRTTEKEILILNLKNVPAIPVELVVQGFFRKRKILISAIAEKTIGSKSFSIELRELNITEKGIKAQLSNYSKLTVTISDIKLKHSRVKLNHPNVQFNHSSFSQTDFI
ncbi:hypothetical protein [Niabella drilacis]|uniref:Uncharacterized protein n=1 Tax=Niabella drilacis (strain DSM 25811 / CCM 8410 / CCUG 62505 / LMG 26954 / E90) TaxID=1285928 RepID=A0A1G6PL05_NIADE|nr:hypothetical protein [Niabella drilacis]SDC80035.1 hypothetical protein SAMN04487894_10452 [Niabella drilacis]